MVWISPKAARARAAPRPLHPGEPQPRVPSPQCRAFVRAAQAAARSLKQQYKQREVPLFVINSLGNILMGRELYLEMTLLLARNGKKHIEPLAPWAELTAAGSFSGREQYWEPHSRAGGTVWLRGPFSPSTTADVDSGPDPTADKDKHSTSQNREDVGELQPAALSLGME